MSVDTLYDEDLPEEARALIEAVESEIAALEAMADGNAERIRKKAERDVAAVLQKKEDAVRQLGQELAARLKPLQDTCAREGQLDEALAIRARIRALRFGSQRVEPAPERMECRPADVGKSFLFDTVGSTRGPVWGTGVYTADSFLAAAAVHAGVLEKGERGVVKVTVLDTRERESFEGSRRNGVTSDDWDEWDYGFTVSRP